MDEMAFMSNAHAINTSCASATPCRLFNSTPNGEGNEFYRMKRLTERRKDSEGERHEPEIKYLRYHWTENPLYCEYDGDKRRYNQKIKGMSREQIAQELDIDYNASVEGRVYPSFKSDTWDLEYDPTKQTYAWIDNSHGGTDPHALVIAQVDPRNHFIDIIDCITMNLDITTMANFVAGVAKFNMNDNEFRFLERYKLYNMAKATFISDPYDTDTMVKTIHNPD